MSINMIFEMTENEKIQLLDWKHKHDVGCIFAGNNGNPSHPQGAIGGRTSYVFTPTGLGTLVRVQCACGEFKDITDTTEW